MHIPRALTALAAVTLALALTAVTALIDAPAGATAAAGSVVTTAKPANSRPNVVLITTDDQTKADMRFMPRTRRLLARQGVNFTNFVSPHPLCCPARAEILTGQYAQSNGVRRNTGRWGGWGALRGKKDTLGTWMRKAGYQTAFMGKFLNGYGDRRQATSVPAGWDEWHATVRGVYRFDDYTVNHNGALQRHRTYQTDLWPGVTSDIVDRATSSGKPFFIWQSHMAPHGECHRKHAARKKNGSCWGPPTPAKRHRGLYKKLRMPSKDSPAFNEKDMSDKPKQVRRLPRIKPRRSFNQTLFYRQRARSLRAVDDAVAATIWKLKRAGGLHNTVVMFTSDNGYLHGEHRFFGKTVGYEGSLRVPMLMRGPGIPRGVVRRQQFSLVDVPYTIAAVGKAGRHAHRPRDGRSMMAAAKRASARGHGSLLIQAGPARDDTGGWRWRGIRTNRYTYMRHFTTKQAELYDRRRDPHQLRSVHRDPRYARVRRVLHQDLKVRMRCRGFSCVRGLGPVPVPKTWKQVRKQRRR